MNLNEVADQVRAWCITNGNKPPYERHESSTITFYQPDDNTIITVGATDGFGLWEHDRNTESGNSAFDHTRASLIEVWHGERDDCNVWFGAAVDGKAGYIWSFPRSGRKHGDSADEKFKDADVDTVLDKLNEIRKAEPANQ